MIPGTQNPTLPMPATHAAMAVIVPTRNRPCELFALLRSVATQHTLPEQIVVVDQSAEEQAAAVYEALCPALEKGLRLDYRWTPGLSGAAAARNPGQERAQGDIVVFLDDDDVLEPDFFEALAQAYAQHPEAAGIGGVVTNFRMPSRARRLWEWLFQRGAFRDNRYEIYRHGATRTYAVDRMTSNAMSFRAAWLEGLQFEESLPGAGVEDIEFCFRLPPGALMLIAPQVRLRHDKTPTARPREPWLQQHSQAGSFLYWRHWR